MQRSFWTVLLIGSSWALAHGAPLLDPSFGMSGSVRVGVAAGDLPEVTTAAAVQRDGRIVLAGSSTDATWRAQGSFLVRLGTDGRPDPSFGQNGFVSPATQGLGDVGVSQIAETREGGLLLGGVGYKSGDYSYHLRRFTAGGAPDTSFGVAGQVSIPLAASNAASFVPQPDGGILVVFDPGPPIAVPAGNPFQLVLVRYTANGGVDAGFGISGRSVLEGLPPKVRLHSLVAEPDGGFTALATALIQGVPSILIRVRANGSLDPSFGLGGVVSGVDLGWANSQAEALLRDELGRYLILGESLALNAGKFGKHLWRLTSTGRLDLEFADRGGSAVSSSWENALWSLGRAGNAPILARVGRLYSGVGAGVQLVKFLESGLPDGQFGTSGTVHAGLPDYNFLPPLGLQEASSGKLLFLATAYANYDPQAGHFGTSDLAVLRLDGAGGIDPDFGGGTGWVTWKTPSYSVDAVESLVEDSAGRLLLVGHSEGSQGRAFFLSRLQPNGATDQGFGDRGRVAPEVSVRCSGLARSVISPAGVISVAAASGSGTRCTGGGVVAFRRLDSGAAATGFEPMFYNAPGPYFQAALAQRTDGRVLFATTYLEQRLSEGTPDVSFGSGGALPAPTLGDTRWSELITLPEGGTLWGFGGSRYFRVLKLLPSGASDESFGTNGMFTHTFSDLGVSSPVYYDSLRLLQRPDGSLLLVIPVFSRSLANNETASLKLLHLSANGKLLAEIAVFSALESGGAKTVAAALPDGGVLMVRRLRELGSRSSSLAMFRLLPDLSLDLSFSGHGGVVLPGLREVDTLVIDRAGRAVLAAQDDTSAVVQRYVLTAPPPPVAIIEFRNEVLGHYFITGGIGEIAAIEAGAAGPGWSRTGLSFRAYSPNSGVPSGALSVCRFYGTPGLGPNSHFYTVDPVECELVKRDPGWTYEGTAFYIFPPTNGQCATGTQAVFRAYNQRFAQNDSNHRYTTDAAVYVQMQAQGWAGEGVKFCGPN